MVLRRVLVIVLFLVLVAAAWMIGTALRSRLPWSRVESTTTLTPTRGSTAVPAGTPGPGEQVEVTVSSGDVPGCYAEGQYFRAHVVSHWRDLRSDITLTYRWAKSTTGGSVLVQLMGNDHQAEVKLGKVFPNVELKLPLGGHMATVTLTTFVFDHWDDSGRACFVWLQPPGVPRRYSPERTA